MASSVCGMSNACDPSKTLSSEERSRVASNVLQKGKELKKAELQVAVPKYKLGKQLGAGGNAIVYKATAGSATVAVKFLVNSDRKRFARFRDEVLVVTTTLKGSPRVIPILEHHLADPQEAAISWYSMPVATTLRKHLSTASQLEVIDAIAHVSEGLAELHALNVAHRDIKPETLFFHDQTYRFGDFGIAKFPERAGLTTATEPMGPAGYMADEMIRDSMNANPFSADILSLAKTLWVLLTNQKFPFLGQYMRHGRYSLDQLLPKSEFIHEPLDDLLEASTHSIPERRPTALEFAETLRRVIEAQKDFGISNPLQWAGAEALALAVPSARIEWTTPGSIVQVLRLLSRRRALNHCFFPSGGGLDVTGADLVEGDQAIMLWHAEDRSLGTVVKPTKLTLERLAAGPHGSYATLETGKLQPFDVDRKSEWDEDLLRFDDYNYAELPPDNEYWPKNAIRVSRYFKPGMFIIAPKAGIFNQLDSYEGKGNALGRDRLRERFEAAITPRNLAAPAFHLKRRVQLVTEQPPTSVFLHGLSLEKFKRALELDAASRKERSGDDGDWFGDSPVDPATPRPNVKEFLTNLSRSEFAELYTLFEFGRGDIDSAEQLATHINENAKSALDVQYFSEKFGNGYFLKALERFGLIPAGDWTGKDG